MFEKALLHKDREEFIELFLSQGVKVHKFLNHKKLKLLFEKAEDREFFVNVCLEGVLGITMVSSLPFCSVICFLYVDCVHDLLQVTQPMYTNCNLHRQCAQIAAIHTVCTN